MPNEHRPHDFDPELKELIRHKAPRLFGRAGYTHRDRAEIEQEIALNWLERLKARPDSAAYPCRVLNQIVSNIGREPPERRGMRHRTRSLHSTVGSRDGRRRELVELLARDRRRDSPPADLILELRQALAELPPRLVAVAEGVLLGLTIAEIAHGLGVNRGTVYRRFRRLVELLREEFLEDF